MVVVQIFILSFILFIFLIISFISFIIISLFVFLFIVCLFKIVTLIREMSISDEYLVSETFGDMR